MKQSREKLSDKNELCISKLNIKFSKIKSILNIIVKKTKLFKEKLKCWAKCILVF